MFDTPEEKAALKAAIDDAVAAARAEESEKAEKLAANNAKLLAQLRDARKQAEIDPAEHAKLQDKVAELEAALDGATKSSSKAAKEHEKALAALQAQYEKEASYNKGLLVDNGLSDALVKAGVGPQFLPAVKAMLKSQVQLVVDGEARVAKVGDKPLSDFVASWAQSDEGKHFVTAAASSGGGAAGAGAGGGGKVMFIQAGDKTAIGANLAELAKGVNGAVQIAQ